MFLINVYTLIVCIYIKFITSIFQNSIIINDQNCRNRKFKRSAINMNSDSNTLYIFTAELCQSWEEKRDASRSSAAETSTRRRDAYERLDLHVNKRRRPKLFAATAIPCPERELFNAEWNNALSKERSALAMHDGTLELRALIRSDDDLKDGSDKT